MPKNEEDFVFRDALLRPFWVKTMERGVWLHSWSKDHWGIGRPLTNEEIEQHRGRSIPAAEADQFHIQHQQYLATK